MNRKIVFLDIDGTLAVENHVPSSAKRACRKARLNGHLLYICTGRARLQVSPAIVRIGFDGIVSSGGAYIETCQNADGAFGPSTADGLPAPELSKNGWKLLFSAAVEPEKLRALLDYLNGRKAAYMLEREDRLIAGPYLKSYFAEYYAGRHLTFRYLLERIFIRRIFKECEWDDGNLALGGVRKVAFWDSGSVSFEDAAREFGETFELFRLSIPVSGMTGGEIGPRGVNKGTALEKVAAYHGFALADTIAFGDSDNDSTMIRRAGLGVAMGNAVDSLKKAAGDVTDSIENDGLAKAFNKYGLI
ncbi:MAG: Cof-type HAD-IIB family hydrolase [Spirochaetaceae bacterium]|nr:Cof-type HAD-IIB family hydrolase [Spirochaetaceae bacterium]